MANVELDIVFLDENAGEGPQQPGGPGVSQAPRAGAPQGFAATVAATQATATVAAVVAARAAVGASGGGQGGNPPAPIIDGASGQIMPYGGRPPQRGGMLDVMRPQQIWTGGGAQAASPLISGLTALAANVGLVVAGFKGLMTALDLSIIAIRTESTVRAQILGGGDVLGAAATKARGQAEAGRAVAPSFLGAVGTGAAGGAMVGGPWGALAGAISGAIVYAGAQIAIKGKEIQAESIEAFKRETDALKQRAAMLGQYSGPLAREQARSQAAQFGRDVSEAQALGPGLAELERSRRAFDTEAQISSALDRLAEIPGQRKKFEDLTTKLQEENNKRLANVDAHTREQLQIMRGEQKSAIEKLLDDIEIPEDTRGVDYGVKRFRDQQMNRPAFGG